MLAVVIWFCLYVFVGLASKFNSVRQVGPMKGCVCSVHEFKFSVYTPGSNWNTLHPSIQFFVYAK